MAKIDDRIAQIEIDRQLLQQEREEAAQEREQLQTLLEHLHQTIKEDDSIDR